MCPDTGSHKFDPDHHPVSHGLFRGLPRFFLIALVWAWVTRAVAAEIGASQFWLVVLAVFVFAVPVAMAGIYGGTIRQIRRLEMFLHRGWLFRLLSGRPLKVVLWFCWALVTAFFMLIQFHTYSVLQWSVFFLVIPVFWICFFLCARLLARELKPYLVTSLALVWARFLCPLVMVCVTIAVRGYASDLPVHASLQAAIDAQQAAVADMQGSALVMELSRYLAFYDGVSEYALSRLGSLNNWWPLILLAGGNFVVYYNACAILSCFLIPAVEWRRVFGPLSSANHPEPVALSRVGLFVALSTFLAGFIYLPLFAYLEAWVQQQQASAGSLRQLEARVISRLEQIEDDYFQVGTMARLDEARMQALQEVEVSLSYLDEQTDLAFKQLEANVDIYLDWYYSLGGEYARIARLMVGDLESYMALKLEQSLQQSDAFREVEAALNQALTRHQQAQELYRENAQSIMVQNRVEPGDGPVEVTRSMSLDDVMSPPVHRDLISLQSRLLTGTGGGAVAGVVSAVVIQKVVAKVVGKNTFKLAAKALAKVVAGKAAGSTAGAGAGAAAGAAIGSVVPGLGTALGAVIGGVAGGIAVGIGVDKMLIEIEEMVSRDQFRAEILDAISQARAEFRNALAD